VYTLEESGRFEEKIFSFGFDFFLQVSLMFQQEHHMKAITLFYGVGRATITRRCPFHLGT
jgi:hypothetical protein